MSAAGLSLIFANGHCRLKTIHLGHVHVHQDEVKLLARQHLNRFTFIVRGGDRLTSLAEDLFGKRAVGLTVFDHKDAIRWQGRKFLRGVLLGRLHSAMGCLWIGHKLGTGATFFMDYAVGHS